MDGGVMVDDQRRDLGSMLVEPHEHPAERAESSLIETIQACSSNGP